MNIQSVYGGIATNIVLGALIYCINKFVENTHDPNNLYYGTIILTNISITTIYVFISKWTTIRSWTFYLVITPIFLNSCFDLYVTVEIWNKPNHFIIKEYLDADDPHLHSIFITMFIFLDGTILHLINFIILYRISNGLSVRSLVLFNTMTLAFISAIYAIATLSSGVRLHLLTKAFLPPALFFLALPFGALNIPRRSILNFKDKKPNSFSKITAALLFLTGLIFGAKALVMQGANGGLLNIIYHNDPIIRLYEIKNTYTFASVQIMVYIFLGLPSLAICVLSQFSFKPSYIWELSIMQAALIITGQFYFTAGAFFWETPKAFQISPYNITFWFINLIPAITVIMQLNSLWHYRVPVESDKIKRKAT